MGIQGPRQSRRKKRRFQGMAEHERLLDVRGVRKHYPGVQALDGVDFTINAGETHVLVGENGAGKSTLVKILCGAAVPDSVDRFHFAGAPAEIHSPRDAIHLGITAIQQHFSLVPHMTAAENIFLGREMSRACRPVNRNAMERHVATLLEEMGVDIDPRIPLNRLDMSHQQVVEIVKAFSRNPKLLIMDEPTSGLTREETMRLFAMIRKIQERGISILYISHRLEEVFEIGDRVTVLRNGRKVQEDNLSETTHAELTRSLIGRDVSRRYPKEDIDSGQILLAVNGLSNHETMPRLRDITFDVRSGEIIALYGILGCGKDELADTLFGRKPATGGSIRVNGEETAIKNPGDAIRRGLGYLTSDRHKDGLVEMMTLRQNLTLASLSSRFSGFGRIDEQKEMECAAEHIVSLKVHAPHGEVLVGNLSGGNQQKVVLGKWLLTEARVLILNEPTKGIDIGSKIQVFELMTKAARAGSAVILMTAEAEEAVEMGDRILILRNGAIAGRYTREQVRDGEVTVDEVLRVATARETEAAPAV